MYDSEEGIYKKTAVLPNATVFSNLSPLVDAVRVYLSVWGTDLGDEVEPWRGELMGNVSGTLTNVSTSVVAAGSNGTANETNITTDIVEFSSYSPQYLNRQDHALLFQKKLLLELPVEHIDNYTAWKQAFIENSEMWWPYYGGTAERNPSWTVEQAIQALAAANSTSNFSTDLLKNFTKLPHTTNATIPPNTDLLAGVTDGVPVQILSHLTGQPQTPPAIQASNPATIFRQLLSPLTNKPYEINHNFLEFTAVSGGRLGWEQDFPSYQGVLDRDATALTPRFVDYDLDANEVGGWLTWNCSLDALRYVERFEVFRVVERDVEAEQAEELDNATSSSMSTGLREYKNLDSSMKAKFDRAFIGAGEGSADLPALYASDLPGSPDESDVSYARRELLGSVYVNLTDVTSDVNAGYEVITSEDHDPAAGVDRSWGKLTAAAQEMVSGRFENETAGRSFYKRFSARFVSQIPGVTFKPVNDAELAGGGLYGSWNGLNFTGPFWREGELSQKQARAGAGRSCRSRVGDGGMTGSGSIHWSYKMYGNEKWTKSAGSSESQQLDLTACIDATYPVVSFALKIPENTFFAAGRRGSSGKHYKESWGIYAGNWFSGLQTRTPAWVNSSTETFNVNSKTQQTPSQPDPSSKPGDKLHLPILGGVSGDTQSCITADVPYHFAPASPPPTTASSSSTVPDPTFGGTILRDNHISFKDFYLVDTDPDLNEIGGFMQWSPPSDQFSAALVDQLLIYTSNSTNGRRKRDIRFDRVERGSAREMMVPGGERRSEYNTQLYATVVFEDKKVSELFWDVNRNAKVLGSSLKKQLNGESVLRDAKPLSPWPPGPATEDSFLYNMTSYYSPVSFPPSARSEIFRSMGVNPEEFLLPSEAVSSLTLNEVKERAETSKIGLPVTVLWTNTSAVEGRVVGANSTLACEDENGTITNSDPDSCTRVTQLEIFVNSEMEYSAGEMGMGGYKRLFRYADTSDGGSYGDGEGAVLNEGLVIDLSGDRGYWRGVVGGVNGSDDDRKPLSWVDGNANLLSGDVGENLRGFPVKVFIPQNTLLVRDNLKDSNNLLAPLDKTYEYDASSTLKAESQDSNVQQTSSIISSLSPSPVAYSHLNSPPSPNTATISAPISEFQHQPLALFTSPSLTHPHSGPANSANRLAQARDPAHPSSRTTGSSPLPNPFLSLPSNQDQLAKDKYFLLYARSRFFHQSQPAQYLGFSETLTHFQDEDLIPGSVSGVLRHSTPVNSYLGVEDNERPLDKKGDPILARSVSSRDCESGHEGSVMLGAGASFTGNLNCRLRELVNANLWRAGSSGGEGDPEIVGYMVYLGDSRGMATGVQSVREVEAGGNGTENSTYFADVNSWMARSGEWGGGLREIEGDTETKTRADELYPGFFKHTNSFTPTDSGYSSKKASLNKHAVSTLSGNYSLIPTAPISPPFQAIGTPDQPAYRQNKLKLKDTSLLFVEGYSGQLTGAPYSTDYLVKNNDAATQAVVAKTTEDGQNSLQKLDITGYAEELYFESKALKFVGAAKIPDLTDISIPGESAGGSDTYDTMILFPVRKRAPSQVRDLLLNDPTGDLVLALKAYIDAADNITLYSSRNGFPPANADSEPDTDPSPALAPETE